jgi:hypothetical protein
MTLRSIETRIGSKAGVTAAVAILFAGGCALPSGNEAGSGADTAARSEPGALASETLIPGDSPSPLPVTLHLISSTTGERPLSALDFEVRSVWDGPVDVKIEAFSDGGPKGALRRELATVHLNARQTLPKSIAVNMLPAQRTNGSVGTAFGITYTAGDGVPRSMLLSTVWLKHEPGYKLATVRDSAQEGRVNAALGVPGAIKAQAVEGRVFDASTGAFQDVTASANARPISSEQGWSWPVGPLPDLPDPQAPGAGPFSGTDEKSGNFDICFNVFYTYVDAQRGEDWLNVTPIFAAPARFMYAYLFDPQGNVRSGYLNSLGCTGPLFHANGDHFAILMPGAVQKTQTAGNVTFNILPASRQAVQIGKDYTISGTGGTITLTMNAVSPVANTGVVVGTALFRSPDAFKPSSSNIYPEEPCNPPFPDEPSAGCTAASASGGTIYLGNDNSGTPRSSRKYVVAHELGHLVQGLQFGTQSLTYGQSSTIPACRCDHVTISNKLHCLQSKEDVNASEIEGFGHFFASDIFNNGADNNCTFVYYKEFLEDGATTGTWPPVAKSCFNTVQWMNNHCGQNERGVEWDWLGFYWHVHNKTSTAYSYANIATVFKQACGGTFCEGTDSVSWSTLKTAADTKFGGSTSAKAMFWASTGDDYGVDR